MNPYPDNPSWVSISDYPIGSFSAGTHTLKIVANSTGVIDERNENDNVYTKTITVQPAPHISVAPTAYNFGNVKVKRNKTASFVVKNTGAASFQILSSTVTGTDAAMFAITSRSGSKTIKPGRSMPIRVVFKPTSTGSKSAILRISSNDPDTLTIDIQMGGTGQ